jgi:hypothetical protein
MLSDELISKITNTVTQNYDEEAESHAEHFKHLDKLVAQTISEYEAIKNVTVEELPK